MMDGADLELFERSLRHATEHHTGPALDAALDELGWREALTDDPRAAVSVLFELQGATNASSSAIDALLARAVGSDPTDPNGQGGPGGRMVLPAIAHADPPGRLTGSRLEVQGIATGHDGTGGTGAQLVVLASTGGDDRDDVVAVTMPGAALDVRPIEGIDPTLGWAQVQGHGIDTRDLAIAPAPDWGSSVALVRVALAHQMVGAARQMLELARTHALERIQFGVAISSFQAVRHRLAETLVAIETAEALLDAAWLDATPATAAMAKALAGREARTAARHCQQVLAGIGFTTEHDFQRYFRRVRLLDGLFGSSATLTRALGEALMADRHLPPLLPL